MLNNRKKHAAFSSDKISFGVDDTFFANPMQIMAEN